MIAVRTAAVALVALVPAVGAQTWTLLSPAPFPNTLARRSGAIAYDLTQARMLVYGGLQSGPTATLNDTWAFDGVAWTQLAPATTPPPRWGHRMVLDTRRLRIVTFGGRSPTTTAVANDTWEWDGLDWQQVFPAVSPNARAFYSMAYDERRGKVVLYGTQAGSVISGGDQTWEYDGTTWAQVVTATTPPGLETPAMVFDKGRNVTVMFGGASGATLLNTTYEFDGVDWTLRTTANAPSGRYRAGAAYDEVRGRMVLYGGFGGGALQDTWEYDGVDWTQVGTVGPVRSTEAYMDYFPLIGQTVHFAGSAPTGTNGETWLYQSPAGTTAAYSTFAPGCAGPLGTPANYSLALPRVGQSLVVRIDNVPAPGAALLYLGGSVATSVFGPLPIDLAPAGAPGCSLYVSTDIEMLGFGLGTITFSQAIPNLPAFLSVPFYGQAFALAPGANALGIIASDASAGMIGN